MYNILEYMDNFSLSVYKKHLADTSILSQYTTLYKNLLLDKSIVTNHTRNYTVSIKAPKVLMPRWISASCMNTVYSDSTA